MGPQGRPVWLVLIVFQWRIQTLNGQHQNEIPNCNYEDTVNLTDSTKYTNGSFMHQGVLIPPNLIGHYDYEVLHGGERIPVPIHLRGCVCQLKRCVKFCCHPKQLNVPGQRICTTELEDELQYSPYINVTFSNGTRDLVNVIDEFVVQEGIPCMDSYILVPQLDDSDDWELFENGTLLRLYDDLYMSKQDYCLVPHSVNGTHILNPLNCPTENIDYRYQEFNSIAMLISTPFFILTILVYLFIPELRNIHGKCLICYLTCLTIGYLIIGGLVLFPSMASLFNGKFCEILGFTAYFSLMSAFLWLSVISFDLWNNLRGTSFNVQHFMQSKQFILYGCFAWGLALIMTILTILVQAADVNESLQPGIGEDYCWLKTHDWSAMIYFYGPNLLLILFNIVMFILTFRKIYQVKRDLERIVSREEGTRKHLRRKKDNYELFLRLFIVMGVSWLLEGISYLYFLHNANATSFWIYFFMLTDFCNAMQGILIFFLFVLKRKVRTLIKNRINKPEDKTLLPIGRGRRKSSTRITTNTKSSALALNEIHGT